MEFNFEFIDADDSDTDTEAIAMENGMDQQIVYAEVLYTFKAVGAEELSLERGALVEVLRMESGPWWWGRIKHDAILSGPQNEPRQGWFPRDFVKVSQFVILKMFKYGFFLNAGYFPEYSKNFNKKKGVWKKSSNSTKNPCLTHMFFFSVHVKRCKLCSNPCGILI